MCTLSLLLMYNHDHLSTSIPLEIDRFSSIRDLYLIGDIFPKSGEKSTYVFKKIFSYTEDLESADINLFSEMWSNIVTREIIMRYSALRKMSG